MSTVRRSVALPSQFLEELLANAPPDLQDNFNRLVHEALREYLERRRRAEFEREMDEMGSDPDILRESATFSAEFDAALMDGLGEL